MYETGLILFDDFALTRCLFKAQESSNDLILILSKPNLSSWFWQFDSEAVRNCRG